MEEFNNWDLIADQFDKALSNCVTRCAKNIAKKMTVYAPVDTGFLRASVYWVNWKSSTYGQARPSKMGRKRINWGGTYELHPEIEKPFDDQTAYAAVGATYGEDVNYGTRYMAAQPFFEPAIDDSRTDFENDLSKIEDKLGQSVGGSIEDESI